MVSDTPSLLSPPKQPKTKKAASPTKQPAKRKVARAADATASPRSRRRAAVASASPVDLSTETLPPADALRAEMPARPDLTSASREDAATSTAPVQAEAELPFCEGAAPVGSLAQVNAEPLVEAAPVPVPKFYLERQGGGFGPFTAFQLCAGLRLGIFKTSDQALEAGGSGWLQISEVLPSDDEFAAESNRIVLTLPPRPHGVTKQAPAPAQPRLSMQACQEPVVDREISPALTASQQGGSEPDAPASHTVSAEQGWTGKKRVLTVVLASAVLVGAVMFALALRLT